VTTFLSEGASQHFSTYTIWMSFWRFWRREGDTTERGCLHTFSIFYFILFIYFL